MSQSMATADANPRGPAGVSGDEHNQYLTFMLQGEMFAIGILAIKEILEYGQLTTVPMIPGFIRGIINLRGAAVPVVDLGARFGNRPSAITKRSCIVILEVAAAEGRRQHFGVLVDAVSAVLEIQREDIEPPPSFGTAVCIDFIAGMGKIGDRFVILLDVDRVLSGEGPGAIARTAVAMPENPALT